MYIYFIFYIDRGESTVHQGPHKGTGPTHQVSPAFTWASGLGKKAELETLIFGS